MIFVKFYDQIDDSLLKFAVILARTEGKWVFGRHRDRTTYEIPGGHREAGETIIETARRELYEETGALSYSIKPVSVYSVTSDSGEETFGMLFCADIDSFEPVLRYEITERLVTETLPESWTYPLIQPILMEEAVRRGC